MPKFALAVSSILAKGGDIRRQVAKKQQTVPPIFPVRQSAGGML